MASSGFLTVEGSRTGPIPGSVITVGREGTIEVFGWMQEVVAERDAASGLPTGRRQHRPFTIIKPVDRASPLLRTAMATGETVSVILETVEADIEGTDQVHTSIELTNATIAQIRTEQLNNKYSENLAHPMTEHVSFVFETIVWTYEPDGVEHEDTWSEGR